MLTKVKDALSIGKQLYIVSPAAAARFTLGRPDRDWRWDTRNTKMPARKELTVKLAVVKHAWESHHMIHWEETTVLDHERGHGLLVKRAMHIQVTPTEDSFN